MKKRNLYLNVIPVEEALDSYLSVVKKRVPLKTEIIPVVQALGRVTVSAVYAKYNSPLYNSAAMDGVAVVSQKTKDACELKPLVLQKEDFLVVDTGDPVHEPFDAVIMAEDLIETDDGGLQITEPAMSWQHIRPVGEDIVAHELILTSNHKIRPMDVGVLLSGGITEIEVYKQVNVAILLPVRKLSNLTKILPTVSSLNPIPVCLRAWLRNKAQNLSASEFCRTIMRLSAIT